MKPNTKGYDMKPICGLCGKHCSILARHLARQALMYPKRKQALLPANAVNRITKAKG